MITAIDFGCHAIRAAYRDPQNSRSVTFLSERSEYVVLPMLDTHREALASRGTSYAECDDSLVVFGNQAQQIRWLSRKPAAPLFADGRVPTEDAPARQILNILTQSMLPTHSESGGYCCFTTPGARSHTDNVEFLSRLIRMHGFAPVYCSSSEATMLACGSENNFTGIAVCMGTEVTEISFCRYGAEIASETLDVGSNWIDMELARQLQVKIWDDVGECYLDLEAIREWKCTSNIHLRDSTGERERTLSRLYGVIVERIARSIRQLITQTNAKTTAGSPPLPIICSGGPTQVGGFADVLTERIVEQDTASCIQSVRVVEKPSQAVVRGLLIYGELEARRGRAVEFAA